MARKSKAKRQTLSIVLDDKTKTITLETSGISLVLDQKAETVTLKAARIVIKGEQIVITGPKGRSVKINDIVRSLGQHHVHRYMERTFVRQTGPELFPFRRGSSRTLSTA